jgi:epoxyqueuosine reductase
LTVLSTDSIKARAAELGFELCGIAAAESYPELRRFDDWLARGYAGEMHYLHRSADRRRDVRRVVPEARSVIVTGTVYNTPRPYSIDIADPAVARISRYAWGDDYHDVLKARLEALVEWMRGASREPFEARAYVDTGPVQERVYAQYAGLGWIGKNTCLISFKRGSWIFLSVVICSLPLEPDPPATDHCGTCTRCLDACPTGALPEPWVLDARRCISYLTIELKGAIPEEHRAAMGSHVYGCDICQDVCPWNRAPLVSSDGAWQPRPALDSVRLTELWQRSDDDWRAAIKGGPMTRARVQGIRRNLAVALGNADPAGAGMLSGGPDVARPSLDDPMVAEHVAWAGREGEAEAARRKP